MGTTINSVAVVCALGVLALTCREAYKRWVASNISRLTNQKHLDRIDIWKMRRLGLAIAACSIFLTTLIYGLASQRGGVLVLSFFYIILLASLAALTVIPIKLHNKYLSRK